MLRPASEPIVNKILPALRAVVAQRLDNMGYSQTEIAELMDVTQPAVSQYLSRRRGASIDMIRRDSDLFDQASAIAEALARGDQAAVADEYNTFCHEVVERDRFRQLVDDDENLFVDF